MFFNPGTNKRIFYMILLTAERITYSIAWKRTLLEGRFSLSNWEKWP